MTDKRLNISSGNGYEHVFGYSRAVRIGDHVCVAGTCAPAGHENSDAGTQARAALAIIEKALGEAGARLEDVVRTVVYVTDMVDADAVAAVHLSTFRDIRPAATLVQVSALARPWYKVEIEATAILAR